MFEFPDEPLAATSASDLDALLRRMYGPDAVFRPQQREAIKAVLSDGARVLLVQATGWGKSAVYWTATRCRRDAGHGPTLVISPLLSLMRDQMRAAEALGLRSHRLDSSNREEWTAIREALEADEVDVLMISPERLANDRFMRETLPAIQGSLGLFVVDEVHCISDWGHDFRPDYRRIGAILRTLPTSVPVLGTTATANARVRDDVAQQLGADSRIIIGPLARASLRLATVPLEDQAERLAWLARFVPHAPGSGIVYCLTVADAERVTAWLAQSGVQARAYHGRLEPTDRADLESMLQRNELKALVATVALGMGFDKPDLGFVIHYQRPGSVVAYYQQVGRAGRAVADADGILLSGREDDDIIDYFIRSAFPPVHEMQEVLAFLDGVDAASKAQIESRVNVPRRRIDDILKLLEVDGAVARDGSRYFRTVHAWAYDEGRVARVTQLRQAELGQMREYMSHQGCLMLFLTGALDDATAEPCGRCMNCRGVLPPHSVDPEVVQQAIAFLRRSSRPIEPRRQWPSGAVENLSGRIDHPNEPGITLSVYGDAGWGAALAKAKYGSGVIGSDLIEAAAEIIRRRWAPTAAGGWWVTAIPSGRKSALVGTAAAALAERLGLPYRDDVLSIVIDTPQQKLMQNSAMQLRNVHDAMSIERPPSQGPVLLIDDIVDSRWTLTWAGCLMRRHGAGMVHPFAFAEASSGDAG